MASTDPWTGARIGDDNDAPTGGTFLARIITDLRALTNARFPTVAARDAAVAAAGITLVDGMRCYTDDAGYFQRVGGAWVAAKTTGLLALSSGWAAYNAYPLPGYHLAADGRVTCHGVMGRTGGNIVVNSAGLLIGSLPPAIRPPDDMQPRIYMGTGSPVTRISATLYVDHTSAGLMQLLPFDGGSYTLNSGSAFVNFDGLTWYI